MNYDVFISYSSKNREIADKICAAIEENGVKCWIAPRDILSGDEWKASIVKGIENCNITLLLFSKNANDSEQVRNEIELTLRKKKMLIPIRIENVEPTGAMEYDLLSKHWLDAFVPPIEQHLDRIAAEVSRRLPPRTMIEVSPLSISEKTVEVKKDEKKKLSAGSVRINPKDGAEMVYVPAGEFIMGSDDGKDDEKPAHKVYLDAFWIYKTPVTVMQYQIFCYDTGRFMPDPPSWGWKNAHPVINVNWNDAIDYSDWAEVRLPTEAEWEKAARGTDGRIYPWGNDWDMNKLHHSDKISGDAVSTSPVGSFVTGASPYGILDMAGNVWQWVVDWYDKDFYKYSPEKNPKNLISRQYHVCRGGSWYLNESNIFRCAHRGWNLPKNINKNNGFRCVAEP